MLQPGDAVPARAVAPGRGVPSGEPGPPAPPGATLQPGEAVPPGPTLRPSQPPQPGPPQPGPTLQPGQAPQPHQPTQPIDPARSASGAPTATAAPAAPAAPADQEQRRALSQVVLELCDSLATSVARDSAERLRAVIERLGGPLQLAVAGRIKSGKSTVVNALIGRRVSPTDVRECTRMVTRFQYGTVDRIEVRKREGGSIALPFDGDGLVPADLGCDPAEVAIVDAYLTNEVLRHVTVIDTPGLASLDSESVGRTRDLLGHGHSGQIGGAFAAEDDETALPEDAVDSGSREAIASAEAVLYVITQSIRADDAAALGAFQNASNPQASSPINAVAVLNKADQVEADDPFAAASELAAEHADTLRHRVSDVIPLVGLVAEATETGLFTEADADTLRAIAELEPDQRQVLFLSADFFLRPEIPVSVDDRERLLTRLDLYGIQRAVELLIDDPRMSTGALRRRLVEVSGFQPLRSVVDDAFRRRADGIKASVALAALEQIAVQAEEAADRERIRDSVEELLQRPEAHQLRLLEAAALVSSGTVTMPEDMEDELTRLVTASDPARMLGVEPASPRAEAGSTGQVYPGDSGAGGTAPGALGVPGDPVAAAAAAASEASAAASDGTDPNDTAALAKRALEAASRWRSFATFGSTPAQSRVAHVVHRGFFLLWQDLRARTDGGAS